MSNAHGSDDDDGPTPRLAPRARGGGWRTIARTVLRGLGVLLVATALPRVAVAGAGGEPLLQLLSPGPTGVATHNQLSAAQPTTVSIDDTAAAVQPGPRVIRGIARGMKNVAVVVPAGGPWTMAQPASDGTFEASVTIPDEAGPMAVDVLAWNSPPNDPKYTVELKLRAVLFVEANRKLAAPLPATHPAAAMRLVWSEEFAEPLSASSASTRNATWFVGGKPSASGAQYSDALFVAADDPRKPFFQKPGFLRIRATHAPDMGDPSGWKRTWWSGHLSTGFPDRSASVELREGYVEARMMLPAGPGAWPAFWLLDSDNTPAQSSYGPVEIDVMEGYGRDPTAYMATEHRWPRPGSDDPPHIASQARVSVKGNPNAFHDYGVQLTRTDVIWFFDGQEVYRAPLYRAEQVSPFFLMLDLGMGGGWPIASPPAGYYDLWIEHVRVYR